MRKPATPYSREISDQVLDLISEGKSLVKACRSRKMPDRCTFLRWVRDDIDGLRERYDIAVDLRAQALADDMLEIAAKPVIGEKVKTVDGKAVEVTTGDTVDRSKLHVDALKWSLARMAPKRFGDKLTQEISGPNGGPIESAVAVNARRIEYFTDLKQFVENLRATVPDPEMRAKIIAGLPDEEREKSTALDRIADIRTRSAAEALDRGFEAAARVEPPASFRGEETEDSQ